MYLPVCLTKNLIIARNQIGGWSDYGIYRFWFRKPKALHQIFDAFILVSVVFGGGVLRYTSPEEDIKDFGVIFYIHVSHQMC